MPTAVTPSKRRATVARGTASSSFQRALPHRGQSRTIRFHLQFAKSTSSIKPSLVCAKVKYPVHHPLASYTSGSVEICATYTGIGTFGEQPTFPESPNLTDPVIVGLLVVRGLVDSPRFTVVLQMAEMAGSMSNLTKTTLKSVNKLDPTKKKTRLYYEYGW